MLGDFKEYLLTSILITTTPRTKPHQELDARAFPFKPILNPPDVMTELHEQNNNQPVEDARIPSQKEKISKEQ